jgi:hypothetical protein
MARRLWNPSTEVARSSGAKASSAAKLASFSPDSEYHSAGSRARDGGEVGASAKRCGVPCHPLLLLWT